MSRFFSTVVPQHCSRLFNKLPEPFWNTQKNVRAFYFNKSAENNNNNKKYRLKTNQLIKNPMLFLSRNNELFTTTKHRISVYSCIYSFLHFALQINVLFGLQDRFLLCWFTWVYRLKKTQKNKTTFKSKGQSCKWKNEI